MELPQSGNSGLSISSIYQSLNQERVNKTLFLDEIEDRKTQMLKQMEQEQFARSKRVTSPGPKVAALLEVKQTSNVINFQMVPFSVINRQASFSFAYFSDLPGSSQ